MADDLTSAADGAAPFAARGADAVLQIGPVDSAGREVVSVDADTRRMAPDQAARTVAGAFDRALGDASRAILVKTIDSTLRGHLRAEIEAALRASGRGLAVVAPAFPAEGRTTRGGTQLLRGEPVDQTSFGSDRTNPVATADLRVLLPGAVLDDGADLCSHTGIVISDAATDVDLDEIVARVENLEQVLWVGSPGLCAALARAAFPPAPPMALATARSVLTVCGSEHAASRAQLHRLEQDATALDLTALDLIDHTPDEAAARIAEALGRGVVTLTDTSTGRSPADVRTRLAAAVRPLGDHPDLHAVIATGGDTARAILDSLSVTSMTVACEPRPGVVAARVDAPRPLSVVLKAGGFGGPDLLHELVTALYQPPRQS